MNKFTTFFFLTFLSSITGCQQKISPFKTQDVNYYFEKINSDSITNFDRIKYNDTLYNFLLQQNNDSLHRNILLKSAREYFKLEQNEKFLKAVKDIYEFSQNANDSSSIAKSLCYIGDYYEYESQNDSAFKYYSKSQKMFESIQDSLNLGRLALYKAGILYDAGIFTESEVQTTKALEILSKFENDRLIYESYNLMGLNSIDLNNYQNALKYFDLAVKRLEKMEANKYPKSKILNSKTSIINNMAGIHEKMGDFQTAIALYKDGLNTPELKQNKPSLYAMLKDNLAYAKMKSGETIQAEQLFLEAAKMRDSLQIKSGIVTGKIHLGEFYLFNKQTSKGIQLIEDGYRMAKQIESTYDIQNALKLLSLNHNTKRSHYAKQYIKINDSLQNIERITRNKFARIAYETDQIEEKNETLSNRYSFLLILSVCSLILFGVLFTIYRLKTKNKELILKQEQQTSNEKIYQLILKQQDQDKNIRNEERNRIAMELHDGIVNRVFTTRFNLSLLQSDQKSKKEQLVQELKAAEAEIRKVSHNLQQNQIFEEDSFQKTIGSLIEIQKNDTNTFFDYNIDKYIDWSIIATEHKIQLYRILQEALQNVNKYAKASKCFVFILKKEDKISVQITDNGVGFNLEKTKKGIGLINIKQRVNTLNGTLKIHSSSIGTTIDILI